jgi:uncharacterized peroxidase-related enzyme
MPGDRLLFTLGAAVFFAATACVADQGDSSKGSATVLPATKKIVVTEKLAPERPTLFFFYRSGSGMEQQLASELEKDGRLGVYLIPLKTAAEPLAKQFEVTKTPVGIVYDRRGRVAGKSSDANGIKTAVGKALGVMRLDWAADDDPRMEQIEKLMGRRPSGGIIRTMSFQPEWLSGMVGVAMKSHFTANYLDLRTHEMIATHVSALNNCKFCLSSHARFFALAGQKPEDVEAVARGEAEKSGLSEKDRLLLDYVKQLTLEPAKVTDKQVEALRQVGFNDEQIFEASFITSLFAFFNRMANAYGLDYTSDGWMPKDERLKRGAPLEFNPAAEAAKPAAGAKAR